MALSDTGVLNFYWPEITGADFYKIKFYKNDVYSFLGTTANTGYQVSGLFEGDTVSGDLYYISGDQPSIESYPLSGQTVNVFNFHNVGSGLSFSGFFIDGVSTSLVVDQGITAVSGSYSENSAVIDFSAINPRDNSNILYINQEPFLTGIKYRTINNLSDSTDFTAINSFSFNAPNPDNTSRSFITQLVLEDFYGSGVTGNIYLDNEPISVVSASKSSKTEEPYFVNDFYFSYDRDCDYAEYYFYENSSFTGIPIITGYTDNPNEFTINFPLETTGYFKLIPYDWFGSGEAYYDTNYLYSEIQNYDPSSDNVFSVNNVRSLDQFGSFEVNSSYLDLSASGSSIYLSIDSGSNTSFDSNSFFTGELNPGSGYIFDYFDYLNQDLFENFNNEISQVFFINLELYSSGTNNLEDSEQINFRGSIPTIHSSGIEFNYIDGITTVEFLTYPNYTFTGVDVLLSGKNFTGYEVLSGIEFSTGIIDYYADAKIVKSSDHNFVFDEAFISGSGLLPRVDFTIGDFDQSDSSVFFNLSRDPSYSPITLIEAYGKYSLTDLSTESQFLGDTLIDFLNFDNFSNYFLQNVVEGSNLLQAPSGIKQNKTYESSGIGFTGFYESGSHFMYRFLPYNGYGSGYVTDPIFVNFPSNANSQQQQEEIDGLNDQVEELKSNFVKLYSDNVLIPSGYCYVNVDYSVAGFTTPPHVVGTLSTYNQEDPILGLIVSGEPTTGSATFVLSDNVESTGYKLKYLASEA